jgi:ubiquinone/menaquinone biosynthesis C-methylase UbiE
MDRPDTRRIWNANATAWTELTRGGFDVYRDLVNTPTFMEILPPVAGLTGLDLGCGEGHNTALVSERAADIVALDISERFIAAARQDGHPGIHLVQGDGARLPFADECFDFVTAFMSLMDVGDPEGSLVEAARVLRPGGFIQFSVVHPATSTPIRRWVENEAGERDALAIGDYFNEGLITERWTFGAAPEEVSGRFEPFIITYTRRTLAGWVNAVCDAGLTMEALSEPHADEETGRRHPGVADTRIVPYFLIIRARKRGESHSQFPAPVPRSAQ